MSLKRDWIERHIPHRGSMCLLDEVVEWTAASIRCRSATHRDPNHPLSRDGRLGIACGIEYAAQAMAVHGALASAVALPAAALPAAALTTVALTTATLTAAPPPQAGLLASLRDVRMFAERLDTVEADLICEAAQVAGDARCAMYSFLISAQAEPLLSGRATVVLDSAKWVRA